MSQLLDRLTHSRMMRAQAENTAAKIHRVEAAAFTTRSLVYYERIEELPDGVRTYPPSVQRAYLHTYNNALKRWGDYGKAVRAAERALRNAALARKTRAAERGPGEVDEDVIRFHARNAMQGPRVQIVTP